jgi:hypothetical protein
MLRATLLYLLLTLAMTWPLAAGIARDVPGDLGDSLLNMWILGWGAEHLPAVATGRMSLHDFWNANIFHPAPLALGFSEHLAGQVLQMLPVYYLTGNLILAYNLLFLSSFVLSGLGMYLLVRDLLGDDAGFNWPAFVAGLIFAFVPFRIAQVAHIQSVSSQWMPLALYGFHRFIRHRGSTPPAVRRRGPGPVASLTLGTAALVMQNLSCGYYLIFFAPCAALFVLHRVWTTTRVARVGRARLRRSDCGGWHVAVSLSVSRDAARAQFRAAARRSASLLCRRLQLRDCSRGAPDLGTASAGVPEA